jgi:signal transduction histidine kinase
MSTLGTATEQSLRRVQIRTTAIAMSTVVVVLVVAALALASVFERELMRQLDERLVEAVTYVDGAVSANTPLSRDQGAEAFAQVVEPNGQIAFATPPLDGRPALLDVSRASGDAATLDTVQTDDHGVVRVAMIRFDNGATLLLASPLEPTDQAVDALTRSLFVGLPFLTLFLGLVVWFTVGRTLRPVAEAAAREQRLVADASHEFRSPLAGVRALLETESTDPASIEQTRHDALLTLTRLEAIADDLLILSRDGSVRPPPGLVDLDEIVLQHARLASSVDARVAIDTTGVSAGQVLGYPTDLERLVDNLLSNAIRHATSTVRLGLREADGSVVLSVEDDGPGIPDDERVRVFERFTRLDDARDRRDGGVGLGLAIVRSVATAHGGTVTATDAPTGGAALVVQLPASIHP